MLSIALFTDSPILPLCRISGCGMTLRIQVPMLWAGAFWNSPDLWIRNADDNGTTHQNPEQGQDNWFYARVRNRTVNATARHFLVTFNVKQFAGVEFQYPGDFLPCVAAVAGFNLGPNSSTIVKARWPRGLVPPAGTHACWLASVLTRFDQPVTGRHVWEHNNLAQKNLTVVNLKPDTWLVLPFVVNNLKTRARAVTLELIRPENQTAIATSLMQKSGAVLSPIPGVTTNPISILDKPDRAAGEELLECGGRSHARAAAGLNDVLTTTTSDGPLAAHFIGGIETAFAVWSSRAIKGDASSFAASVAGTARQYAKDSSTGRCGPVGSGAARRKW